MNPQSGKLIIFIGIAIVVIGLLVYFFHDKLTWLGKLPGDIRVEKEDFRFYFPITTMIILSLLATLVINLIRKLF